MLLIYGAPILAGIIGSRYLSRFANFCLMVVVFQFDIAILFGGLFAPKAFVPYTVVAIIPAIAGIIGGKYLGDIANTFVVLGVCYIATELLTFYVTGSLRLVPPLGAIFISQGSLFPPLVFILVAIVAYNLRQWHVAEER